MPVLSGWKNISMKPFINCDMGEGAGNDQLIMPYIDSANIACGLHAGDAFVMRDTIAHCLEYHVAIGAHPSFDDRENFGRKEMELPVQALYELIIRQLSVLSDLAEKAGTKLDHVKPHGALYNMSARDPIIAAVIAHAVKDFDPGLVLYGLSGSPSIHQAKRIGLKTANEVFADRTYRDDATLTPRSEPGALIRDTGQMLKQVLQLSGQGTVTSITGKTIQLEADTICIHGDGEHALEFAKAIHEALKIN